MMVPSGASTGAHEALELRDGPAGGFGGKAVTRAAANVDNTLRPAVQGFPAEDQAALDSRMIELDGTPNKSRLGANAILGVSASVARAVANSRGLPLWKHLAGERQALLPVPMINILSGGLHAGKQIEFQDFLAVPHGFETVAEALEATVAIHRAMERLLKADGHILTGVADEGGLGPRLETNALAMDYMVRAIEAAGYRPGEQVSIAIDVASTHFFHNGRYHLESEGRTLDASELIELFDAWTARYPILSIEDPLAEGDWDAWVAATKQIGSRCRLIGDDLFVTNPARLERGIAAGAANSVLVKMNQIGTLTETFQVIDRAREAGYTAVISARSGETEDDFLADLAIASGAGQIKVGSITRSERLSKYNRLLRVEQRATRGGDAPASFAEATRRLCLMNG
jgi:enolase